MPILYPGRMPSAIVLVLGLVLTPTIGRAAPAPGEITSRSVGPVEKIRKELDRTINLDLDQQPLALAINQLHEQTRINFVIDRFTLAQNNVDPDQATVNLKLKDIKVRSALRSLLTPYNLNYAILGDTVLISSDEVAMLRQLRQRVDIDLEKVELAKALKQLARQTGTNLVVDSRVGKDAQAQLSLQMEDVPLETAVRLMAEMVNLKPVRVGNTLFVTSKAYAGELRNDPDLQPGAQPGNPAGDRILVAPMGAPPAVAVPPGPVPPPPLPPGVKPMEGEEEKPAEKPAGKPDKPEKPAAPEDTKPTKPS
jgi:type II secretory pathway component GspD/PulD (secretin)